MKNIRKSKDGG